MTLLMREKGGRAADSVVSEVSRSHRATKSANNYSWGQLFLVVLFLCLNGRGRGGGGGGGGGGHSPGT